MVLAAPPSLYAILQLQNPPLSEPALETPQWAAQLRFRRLPPLVPPGRAAEHDGTPNRPAGGGLVGNLGGGAGGAYIGGAIGVLGGTIGGVIRAEIVQRALEPVGQAIEVPFK